VGRRRHYRRQPPVAGGRDPVLSCLIPEIRDAVRELADTHNVRPSWVISKILADVFGIKAQPDFSLPERRRKAS
jgi:hypothetical protein